MIPRHRAHCAVSADRPFALPVAALRIPRNVPQTSMPGGGADRRKFPRSPVHGQLCNKRATLPRRPPYQSGGLLDRFVLAGDPLFIAGVCRVGGTLFRLPLILWLDKRRNRLPPLDAANAAPLRVE